METGYSTEKREISFAPNCSLMSWCVGRQPSGPVWEIVEHAPTACRPFLLCHLRLWSPPIHALGEVLRGLRNVLLGVLQDLCCFARWTLLWLRGLRECDSDPQRAKGERSNNG